MARTEQDYIHSLRVRWPRDADATLEDLALADEAVDAWPHSSRLWLLRAALIQLGPRDSSYPLAEALRSYEQAVAADPADSEALEDLGHFYGAVLNEPAKAAECFRRARGLAMAS